MTALSLRAPAPHRLGNLHSGTPAAKTLLARRDAARAKNLAANPLWRPLLVGEDIDGVNYPFDPNYRAYLVSHCGFDPVRAGTPAAHWFFYRDMGQSDEEFVATCHAAVDAGILFRTGTPYEGAAESWQDMIEAGHEIHIITDRRFGTGDASLDATIAWLGDHGFWYDSITISADKAISPDIDVFVEDRTENRADLIAEGIPCYLVTQTWNTCPAGDDFDRVPSQVAFAGLVITGQVKTRTR